MSLTTFPIPTTPLSSVAASNPLRTAKFFGKKADGSPAYYDLGAVTNSYDLRHFGVVANGTTDDSAALASAFAAIPAGSVVDFPQGGTVLMTSYVTIPVDHLTIRGNGCKIISNATGQDRKFLVSGRTGIKFDGLRIDGGELTAITPAAEWYTYMPDTNPGTIHFLASSNCSIEHCAFTGVNFPVTILGGCDGITVSNNRFGRYYSAIHGTFTGSGVSEVSPKNIKVLDNVFTPGLHPHVPVTASGSAVSYSYDSAHDSGAIKFRGHQDLSTATFAEKHNYSIIGNSIDSAGELGIELQTINDSCVIGNQVYNAALGISVSFAHRNQIMGNSVSLFSYCGIEVAGNNNSSSSLPGCDSITLNSNIVDGRDQYGRIYHHAYNHYGIVTTDRIRGLTITGGEIRFCRTGIGMFTGLAGHEPEHILISGVRIETNDESGFGGGLNSGTVRHAIYAENVKNLDIFGSVCVPGATAYQRMIYLGEVQNVKIAECTVVSNNNSIYIQNSSDVVVSGCNLKMGGNPVSDTAGTSFIAVDSTNLSCERIQIHGTKFTGTADSGIVFYSPANHISGVAVYACDTREAAVPPYLKFLALAPSGSGSITGIKIGKNIGPGNGSPENNIDCPTLRYVTGTFNDDDRYETLFCEYNTTVNLQTAIGCAGIKKVLILTTGSSTLTIHPRSGETINGSSSDQTVTAQWGRISLQSNGTDWIIVG